MSVNSTASTTWNGDLESGSGRTLLQTSGEATLDVNWQARSQGSRSVTTPEELLAAAHSSCYSMALAKTLADNGTPPTSIDVSATVNFTPGTGVTGSVITVHATVPGIERDAFEQIADQVKDGCPISQALAIDISLGKVTLSPWRSSAGDN